jgi:uncharacterized protein with HEPN domain
MPFRRRVEWLRDIVANCDRIERHVGDATRESFAADEKTSDAVERCLQRICEAAKRLRDNERRTKLDHSLDALYPEVPWDDVRGMGDVLRHDYDSIDREIVWGTIKALSALRGAAIREIARLEPPSGQTVESG